MCSVSSNEKVRCLRYVTTLDKIRNEDGNKCIYDKRKKMDYRKNQPQGWVTNAQKIPVFWGITRCITQKSEVLTKDWFSHQYNHNGKYSGPNLLCERGQ
jgi:hypothetical protein